MFDVVERSIRERMATHGLHEALISDFLHRVHAIYDGESGKINWDEIEPLHPDDTLQVETFQSAEATTKMDEVVILKLNGGLGTSMGLSRAKSIITVKQNENFLGIILKQIDSARRKYRAPFPLLFMNSFNTRDDTFAEPGLAEINNPIETGFPVDFLQNRVPRLYADTLMPFGGGLSSQDWCPPGHGDLYLSLEISGLLDRLLAKGYRTAFISNGDNLGALFDERLYAGFLHEKLDFAMEITPKTKADLKGGILIRHGGHIELLEIGQVESWNVNDFQNTTRYSYFNTNNLWINLESLRDRLGSGLSLSMIVNPKQVEGAKVIQVETAMGSAIGCFERTKGFVVPRTRFAPVKSCADLLVRRSDLYTITDEWALVANPNRTIESEPIVSLDENYRELANFERLFENIPSLIAIRSLSIAGPILFDQPIALTGDVTIFNSTGKLRRISELGRSGFSDETVSFQ